MVAEGGIHCEMEYLTSSWILFPIVAAVALLRTVCCNEIPEISGYRIVNEYPHDPGAYTQGLLFYKNDTLYESTGIYGMSSVREVELETGKITKLHQMTIDIFAEGLTLWENRLLQVAWLSDKGFIYDRESLKPLGTFVNPMQDGWGLAQDGKHIIGSDGSSTLYFLSPHNFTEVRRVSVTYKGEPIYNLNELEYVKGEVWANVYVTECIARIQPETGEVVGWIVLDGLRNSLVAAGYKALDVMNGIAWDSKEDRLFVTGKFWPKMFEIVPSGEEASAKACFYNLQQM